MNHSLGILLALVSLLAASRAGAQHDGQYEYRLRNELLYSELSAEAASREAVDLPQVTVFLLDGRHVGRKEALGRIRLGNVLAARRTVCKPRNRRVADRLRLVYVELLTETTSRMTGQAETGAEDPIPARCGGDAVPVSVSSVPDTTGSRALNLPPGAVRGTDHPTALSRQ